MNEYIYETGFGVNEDIIKRTDADGVEAWIPTDPANSDYAAYLETLETPAKATKGK
jgi:hypothetical protein